jgi:hypothetical protein
MLIRCRLWHPSLEDFGRTRGVIRREDNSQHSRRSIYPWRDRELVRLAAAGDVPKAFALMSPVSPASATEMARRGYATGFVAALVTSAIADGISAVVAVQTRSARGRSSSQTALAVVEERHRVSKPFVSAAPVRACAARTPAAAPGVAEREEPCSV